MIWFSPLGFAILLHSWRQQPLVRLALIIEGIALFVTAILYLLRSPITLLCLGMAAVTMCAIFHMLEGEHGWELRLVLGSFFAIAFGVFANDAMMVASYNYVTRVELLWVYTLLAFIMIGGSASARTYETGAS